MEMETTTTATCTAEASAAAAAAATTTAGALPVTSHDLQLPPGFRFHPTDEELVVHYLTRKLASHSFKPIPIVTEVDLYKFDPWELPQQAAFGEKEWYFFSPRDRKYPNGVRPNRAAASGYWKATGTDKIIYSSTDGRKIGVKKALVFYKGRAPKGVKSNWIMHEYRLVDASNKALSVRKKGSLRLDDWVLCRIYKKKAKAHNRASTKSENTRKNNQSFEEDILAALPEIDEATKLSFPQLGGSMMNKFMEQQNDSFMQVLLSGGHDGRGLSMNQLSALDLLQRNSRQTPTTTEMLFPTTTTLSKDGIWQFGGILDQRKEDMSPSQQSTSLALLDSLRQQQQHAGRAGLIHEDFQRDYRNQHWSQQQHHHEVVDESFTRNTPILFPPATHLSNVNFNNSFTLHSGAY